MKIEFTRLRQFTVWDIFVPDKLQNPLGVFIHLSMLLSGIIYLIAVYFTLQADRDITALPIAVFLLITGASIMHSIICIGVFKRVGGLENGVLDLDLLFRLFGSGLISIQLPYFLQSWILQTGMPTSGTFVTTGVLLILIPAVVNYVAIRYFDEKQKRDTER